MPPIEQEATALRLTSWRVGIVIVAAAVALIALLFSWQLHKTAQPSEVGSKPVGETASTTPALEALHPVSLTFTNGKKIALKVPQNYSMDIAAEGFRRLRFMSWSPDRRLFVGEMTSASDTNTGRVVVFDDFDEATGRFKTSHVYLDNLRNPNSVAFYTDPQGVEWICIAVTDKLLRYRYTRGAVAPDTAPQTVTTFPEGGRELMAGGWHITRTLAFLGDQLFVSVGSSCNSCEEKETDRAAILKMNADGSGKRVYASGLRNAVGLVLVKGALYSTANEADQLGNDRPNDAVYRIEEGANYGWPYCYEYSGAIYKDDTTPWQKPSDCSRVPLAFAELEPHSAPLGIEYIDETFADSAIRDAFLVGEHGSGKVSIGTGNVVSLVRKGSWTPFVSGFLQNGVRQGRAVDVLKKDERSFFVTDDLNGALYYLRMRP